MKRLEEIVNEQGKEIEWLKDDLQETRRVLKNIIEGLRRRGIDFEEILEK